ncbi:MAG: hypothetical protein A2381_11615 [Bdellovibrionales bacterium RIFOXYB1_FULL_37_110]|nr:MAG: hypothetical protein A2417_11920 [Bdellovibrionales bacterium RIFOXYC1_FULL_37_79]OFZ57357.1 MAG: hypothetical protein A2381_11615 [Bdellovibrionales bacterium RIFOXYB1_FULL_37_110]OFZ62252.1 MAG: hypothetical protein A2577_14165 [Bdellovibrionales bacterium RIFOXYD1_FULL_36_51]
MYLLIGDRKVKRIALKKAPLYPKLNPLLLSGESSEIKCIINKSSLPTQTQNNQFKPLSTGKETYQNIMHLLQNAKSSIHIATYIFGNDLVGKAILEVLCEKASSGVDVKLLLDGVGSFWFPRYKLKRLTKAKGAFAFFVPFFRVPFSGYSSLRNHRKMILIDGKEAILGGMNISKEYMGKLRDEKRWIDFCFFISGEALTDFENLFMSDWSFATGKFNEPTQSFSFAKNQGSELIKNQTPIQVITSGPDVAGDPLYDILLTQIFLAKKRIFIATPYFIPDESLTRAIELACRRGIDVQIFVPLHSDHVLPDLCRRSYLRQISLSGGIIHYFYPQMLHSKLTVIDETFALIGSANFDMRSLLYNYEVGVLLSSKHEVQLIKDQFDPIIKSTRLAHFVNYTGSNYIEGIGRIMAPLL